MITTFSLTFRKPKIFLRRRKWRVSPVLLGKLRTSDYPCLDRVYKRREVKRRFNLFKYNKTAFR